MSGFFKTFWAALLAFVVGNIILGILSVLLVMSVMMTTLSLGTSAKISVSDESVLMLDFATPIKDSPVSSPMSDIDLMAMKVNTQMSLFDVISAIEQAAGDPNISGIMINTSQAAPMGMATRSEIRNALAKFKESGKFIVSYADYYSQLNYFLSSVSDNVYLNPEGVVEWVGLSSNIMFYKGLLDKLGVQPEVIRHGRFKSAVEPFILDKMSPENRLQINTMLGSMWNKIVEEVADARNLDSASLQNYASELAIGGAEDARRYGLVDSLVYQDQVMNIIGEMTSQDADDVDLVSLSDYMLGKSGHKKGHVSKNKVAVIYAEGEIVDGNGSPDNVGGERLRSKLSEAREDDRTKAVVLRVNSPGGSALASEVIWREMELLRAEKPVIVSMGDYAASGGYYISCPADVIVASPYTLTGSIGVFGLLFNIEKGLKDKLGITVDVAKTNQSADMMTPFRSLTPAERQYVQNSVNSIYETFTEHVAQGRNMTVEAVDKIGEGRVWSGVTATQIGLVDGFGGITDAIMLAADRAGVAGDFRVSVIADPEDKLSQIIRLFSSEIRGAVVASELKGLVEDYQRVVDMMDNSGVHAIMPYSLEIH